LPSRGNIGNLKKEFKAEKPNDLRDIDADKLIVWRCKNPSLVINRENMEDQVMSVFSNAAVQQIDEATMLTHLNVLPNEKLFLRLPSVFSHFSFNRAILTSVVQNHP
jgi:hypothetical protein